MARKGHRLYFIATVFRFGSFIFLALTVNLVNPQGEDAYTFWAAPNNVSVTEGSTVSFNCAVGSSKFFNKTVWYLGKNTLFVGLTSVDAKDNHYCEKMSNETLQQISENSTKTFQYLDGYTLKISPVNRVDDDEVKCRVNGNMDRVAYLTVLSPPTPPKLTSDLDSSQWEENRPIRFTCTSSSANPYSSVAVSWFINGKKVFPEFGMPLITGATMTTTPPAQKYGQFTSDLRFNLTLDIFDDIISCKVEHRNPPPNETWSFTSESLTLRFKYGPYIEMTVSTYSYSTKARPPATNSIRVMENTTLILKCGVDLYPRTSDTDQVMWIVNGNTTQGTTLTLEKLSKDQNGYIYTCRAENGPRSKEENISINILYPPKLSYPGGVKNSSVYVVEGAVANFSFVIDANPVPDSSDFVWTLNSKIYMTGPYLHIPVANRSDSSTYDCTLTNRMLPFDSNITINGTQKLSLDLIVIYPPGLANISLNKGSAYLGGEVNITCNVSNAVHADISIIWERNGVQLNVTTLTSSFSSSTPSLTFCSVIKVTNIGYPDGGNYTCRGKNEAGEGESSRPVYFEIYELPKLISFYPTDTLLEPKIADDLTSFRCVVSAKPQPAVSWAINNFDIDPREFDVNTTVDNNLQESHTFVVTSILTLKRRLVASDAGNYSCLVTLPSNDPLTMRAILVAVKQPPIFTNPLVNVATDVNRTTFMSCQCSAYPIPSLVWSKDGKEFQADSRPTNGGMARVNVTRRSWLLMHESLITITQTLESDAGEYLCNAENIIGRSNRTFRLIVKTPPKLPILNESASITWESVGISWTPGSNGGYPQVFRVFYRLKDPNLNARDSALFGSGLDGAVNVTEGNSVNITGLLPGRIYIIKLVGYNLLGNTGTAPEYAFNTTDYSMPPAQGIIYYVRSSSFNFPRVDAHPEPLCLLIRPANHTEGNKVTIQCQPVGEGQYELRAKIDSVEHDWEASWCLVRRNNVCGETNMIEIDRRPIGKESIIAIAVLCPLVFIALLVLLGVAVCLCRRNKERNNAAKNRNEEGQITMEDEPISKATQVSNNSNNSNSFNSNHSDKQCYENDGFNANGVKPTSYLSVDDGFQNDLYRDSPSSNTSSDIRRNSDSGFYSSHTPPKKNVYHEVIV